MAARFAVPSALMGAEDECSIGEPECYDASSGVSEGPVLADPTTLTHSHDHVATDAEENPTSDREADTLPDGMADSSEGYIGVSATYADPKEALAPSRLSFPARVRQKSGPECGTFLAADVGGTGNTFKEVPPHDAAQDPGGTCFTTNAEAGVWKRTVKAATASASSTASVTASAVTRRLIWMQAFISRLLATRSKALPGEGSHKHMDEEDLKYPDVAMAFHQRGRATELLQYHFMILILAVTVAFGTQNSLAPNLSRIADTFHFSEAERDIRVGGELAFLYYIPGCIGALTVGLCAGVLDRNKLVSAVLLLSGLASLCTFFVNAYWQLAALRLVAGLASGGVHPLAYSLVGDWFGPSLRSCASAFVLGAAGFGTFCGQCLAALLGSLDWRWVFLILAAPLLFMAHFYYLANGRPEGPLTHHMEFMGAREQQELSLEGLKGMAKSKTNILMLLQAFPGNVPWGVLVVYLHDFLRTDIGLTDTAAIAAIVAVAAASFCGMIVANIGAVLLNVNTAEVRGTICAIYTVLDDVSKALGTVVASLLGALVGSRALAFQLSMSLWLLSAAALFAASNTYAADEARVIAGESNKDGLGFRQLADEGAQDRMPLILKHQQQASQQEASALCQCLVHETHEEPTDVGFRVLKQQAQLRKPGSSDAAAGLWEQLEDHGWHSHSRSRL
ncbi:major facilitator related protein [Cyclospora cayetanensis]|uniref:Major facilitator related protein n=1 Tax=Cyclospora cayetanensis TaxID=88456 RepID=A0A1D3D1H8_9EIME|nr:major facilitator related protein [Cyclospora cayetanensis]